MKKVIITGASSGIGYALAKIFSVEKGYEVLAIARREDRLLQLKEEVKAQKKGGKLFTLALDIEHCDFNEVYQLITDKWNGEVHILINNAGQLVHKPFLEIENSDFSRVFGVNVFGVIKMIQECHSFMKKTHGHIINISSMGGYQGSAKFPGLSVYSASKSAVACLSECLAEEFKEDGIKVNALALGAVQTEMLNKAFPGYQAPVTAEQMAKYVSDFADAGSAVYNGKVLPVSLSTP